MEISSASLYNKLEGNPGAVLQEAALSVLKDAETRDGDVALQLLQDNPAQSAQKQLAEGKPLDVRA